MARRTTQLTIIGLALATTLAFAAPASATHGDGGSCAGVSETHVKKIETDYYKFFKGTQSRDVVEGSNRSGVRNGVNLGDVISLRGAGDLACGRDGDDDMRGDKEGRFAPAGPDEFYGDDGDDSLRGERKADDLSGGPDDDNLFGGAGADVLDGGPGDDRCQDPNPGTVFQSCEHINGVPP